MTALSKGATAASDADNANALLKLWRNKEARSVIVQIFTIAALFAFLAFIINNAILNLAAVGKTFSFDFLGEPASYDINQTLIEYTSRDTHARAYIVGVLNTALVAATGIVLATIMGFVMGVLRLSHNFLMNRIVYCIIEFVRNVPVLIQILIIHGFIINILPGPRQAVNMADVAFLSNRGFSVPAPVWGPGAEFVALAVLVAVGFIIWFRRHAKKIQDETGRILPVLWTSIGVFIGLPLVVFLLVGAPLTWDVPALRGFNFQGGLVLRPEYLALTLALSIYTSAFIAEIVRAGILAVPWGQTEASYAVGLRPNRTLQLVVIPQALRVIVPPLASQYLNLTKNSSLAIAIGYMDIVATIGGITLMQTGKEMETMIIVLLTYLCFSLMISAFMNWYNKKIKLVER